MNQGKVNMYIFQHYYPREPFEHAKWQPRQGEGEVKHSNPGVSHRVVSMMKRQANTKIQAMKYHLIYMRAELLERQKWRSLQSMNQSSLILSQHSQRQNTVLSSNMNNKEAKEATNLHQALQNLKPVGYL